MTRKCAFALADIDNSGQVKSMNSHLRHTISQTKCWPEMDRTAPDLESFGDVVEGVPCANASASCRYNHSWHNSSLKGSTAFATATGVTEDYGRGGFAVELPRDRNGAVATIAQLERDFLGPGTRALAVSFNIYNLNADILVVFQASFEFHSTGHIEPYARIAPVQLMGTFYYVRTAGEEACLWTVFSLSVFFIAWELVEFFSVGPWRYFSEFWNAYELVDVGLLYYAIYIMWDFQQLSTEVTELMTMPEYKEHYFDTMDELRPKFRHMKLFIAINISFSIVKMFKYLQLSKRMSQLWEVLQRAFNDMVAFLIILLFIILAFAICGCVVFGDHERNFHNIPSTFKTMLYFVVGDFSSVDYSAMKQANSSFTPLFFSSFLIMVVIVAINMFIAILMDFYEAYKNEKENEHKDRQEFKAAGVDVSLSLAKHAKDLWLSLTSAQWKLQEKNVAVAVRNTTLKPSAGHLQPNCTVVVAGIPTQMMNLPLTDFITTVSEWFSDYEIKLVTHGSNSKGDSCFVEFANMEDAKNALGMQDRLRQKYPSEDPEMSLSLSLYSHDDGRTRSRSESGSSIDGLVSTVPAADIEADKHEEEKKASIYLKKGTRVRIHINRLHFEGDDEVDQRAVDETLRREDGTSVRRFSSDEETDPIVPERANCDQQPPRTKIGTRASAVGRERMSSDVGDLETGDTEGSAGSRRSRRMQPTRSFHVIAITDRQLENENQVNEEKGMSGNGLSAVNAGHVVIGLLRRRSYHTSLHKLPTESTRQMLERFKPGETAYLQDQETFLGDKVTLEFIEPFRSEAQQLHDRLPGSNEDGRKAVHRVDEYLVFKVVETLSCAPRNQSLPCCCA